MSDHLVSRVDVKEYMGLTDTTVYDDLIDALIEAADAVITSYPGWDYITVNDYDEYYDIPTSTETVIALRHFPVVTFIELIDDDETVDTDDYVVDKETGMVKLKATYRKESSRYFTMGVQKVRAKYSAGFVTVPKDLELVAKMVINRLFQRRASDGYLTRKIGSYSEKIDPELLGQAERQILSRYVRTL